MKDTRMRQTPALFAKITARSGRREELVEALRAMLVAVESEPGTVRYVLHTDDSNPDVVWFYESYRDEAALAAHRGTEAMRQIRGRLEELAAGPTELTMLTVVGGKGLDAVAAPERG